VQGSGCRVQGAGLWFMVYGLCFMFYVLCFMFMVYGLWSMIYGLGFRVQVFAAEARRSYGGTVVESGPLRAVHLSRHKWPGW